MKPPPIQSPVIHKWEWYLMPGIPHLGSGGRRTARVQGHSGYIMSAKWARAISQSFLKEKKERVNKWKF